MNAPGSPSSPLQTMRRADLLDAPVPEDEAEKGGEDAGVGDRQPGARREDDLADGEVFEQIERQGGEHADQGDGEEKGQRVRGRAARQQQSVNRPGEDRKQNPDVAEIEGQRE